MSTSVRQLSPAAGYSSPTLTERLRSHFSYVHSCFIWIQNCLPRYQTQKVAQHILFEGVGAFQTAYRGFIELEGRLEEGAAPHGRSRDLVFTCSSIDLYPAE